MKIKDILKIKNALSLCNKKDIMVCESCPYYKKGCMSSLNKNLSRLIKYYENYTNILNNTIVNLYLENINLKEQK